MSAIFGLVRHDGRPVEMDELKAMADPVAHRGPDGMGLFAEGGAGLGFARLQTCPEREPESIDGRSSPVVVATARLDNRPELLSQLDLPPDSPDTRILQEAFRQWGADGASRLLGAFAFAAWDRQRQTLTLVRDQIGVRPLYVAQVPGLTAFASDPRSLLGHPEVPGDIDDLGILCFFVPDLLFHDKETTCYAAIKRLPPAHVLEIPLEGKARRKVYWALDPDREIRLANDDEYCEAFQERMTLAVGRRLRSTGPVGSKLSGGLDSSSITCVAAGLLKKEGRPLLHTFSAEFPDTPESDESALSRAVVNHLEVEHHPYYPGQVSPLADLDPVMASVHEPFYAVNFFIVSGACREARDAGVRVLLDGTDGDTAVGHGVDLLHDAAVRHDWKHFAREAEAVASRFATRTYATSQGIVNTHALPELRRLAKGGQWWPLLRGIQGLGGQLGLSRKRLLFAALEGRKQTRPLVPDLTHLNPDFLARVQAIPSLEKFYENRARLGEGRRPLQYGDLASGAVPAAMELFDRIGAGYRVEQRYPFCDRELWEFCLALPYEQQLRDGWSRWIMRKAMSSCLPEKVCWRGGKASLAFIVDRSLRIFEAERMAALVRSPAPEVLEFIRPEALSGALDRYTDPHKGGIRTRGSARGLLWRAMVLERWLKT